MSADEPVLTEASMAHPSLLAARAIMGEWSVGTASRFCDDAPDWDSADEADVAEMIREAYANNERERDRLRLAIVHHRSQHADDRCWLDDQQLYAALGDGNLGDNTVGDPAAMRRNCDRFIAQRCAAGGGWKSYAELEAENAELLARLDELEPSIAKVCLTAEFPMPEQPPAR